MKEEDIEALKAGAEEAQRWIALNKSLEERRAMAEAVLAGREMRPVLRVKRLSPTAIIPQYQTAGAGGLDLHVDARGQEFVANNIAGPNIFPTGLALEIPRGYVGLIRPRSSAVMRGTRVLPGTIDSDYRGEVGIQVEGALSVKHGERIAQLVLVPAPQMEIVEVSVLSETARGTGGYGSTGR